VSVNRNIAAIALGNAWAAVIQVACVPLYIALLGPEAFGLIGVYAVIAAAFAILDLGTTRTLGREMAFALARDTPVDRIRDLLRSAEWLLGGLALALTMGVALAAPTIARAWLHVEDLSPGSAAQALRLIGVVVAMRLVMGPYRGIVTGAQRLDWMALAGAGFATLRALGVLAVLTWYSATPEAFFTYMAAITAIELAVMASRAWTLLPGTRRPAFSVMALRRVGGFSASVAVLSVLYTATSQADKLLLSALLPLGSFGYYALGAGVAAALTTLFAPIGAAAYPRFSELAASRDAGDAREAFHYLAQMATVAVVPVTAVLALFPREVLFLWTGDAATAQVAGVMAWLAAGTMLSALLSVPHILCLAHGRAAPVIAINVAFLVVLLPALWFGVQAEGVIAAGHAWVLVHALGLACTAPLVGALLGARAAGLWLLRDIAAPVAACFMAAGLPRLAVGETAPGWAMGSAVAAAMALASAACIVALPIGRSWARLGWARVVAASASRA
jgi:O-antigen/teichoic acid export membrane protein